MIYLSVEIFIYFSLKYSSFIVFQIFKTFQINLKNVYIFHVFFQGVMVVMMIAIGDVMR